MLIFFLLGKFPFTDVLKCVWHNFQRCIYYLSKWKWRYIVGWVGQGRGKYRKCLKWLIASAWRKNLLKLEKMSTVFKNSYSDTLVLELYQSISKLTRINFFFEQTFVSNPKLVLRMYILFKYPCLFSFDMTWTNSRKNSSIVLYIYS